MTSSAGAQGIAQFMPGTAAERGLLDPYDPEQAIPASAHFLAELNRRFGSLGLAAAAYNGGPTRVADWLAGRRQGLPYETQDYVFFITGKGVDAFRGAAEPAISKPPPPARTPPSGCLALAVDLRRATPTRLLAEAAFAPWGVQLSGAFSKAVALGGFARAQQRYGARHRRDPADGDRHAAALSRHAAVLPRAGAGGDAGGGQCALHEDSQGGRRLHRAQELSVRQALGERLQAGLDRLAARFEERRQSELLAERRQRFVGGEARAVGGDLEQDAVGLAEIEAAEIEAVDRPARRQPQRTQAARAQAS